MVFWLERLYADDEVIFTARVEDQKEKIYILSTTAATRALKGSPE
jgi:hypothetical protein